MHLVSQRWGQMAEHRDDEVPRLRLELERLKVGDPRVNLHSALGGESSCLHDADRAQVYGHHVMTELREKHTVAALAVAETECATLRQTLGNIAKEVVRLCAEGKTIFCVSLVPTLAAGSGARHAVRLRLRHCAHYGWQVTLEAVSGATAMMLGIAFIWPQVVRVYRKKSVEGVAPLGTVISIAGTMMWLVYGVATESVAMILSNLNIKIAFLFMSAYLVRKKALPLWAPLLAFAGTLIFSIVVVRYSVTMLGVAGVVIGTPGILPQFWRAVRSPRLYGVSVVSFTLLATMGVSWFTYGLTIGDPVVSYPNLVLIPCSSFIAWKAWRSHHNSMVQRNVMVVETEPAR